MSSVPQTVGFELKSDLTRLNDRRTGPVVRRLSSFRLRRCCLGFVKNAVDEQLPTEPLLEDTDCF